MSIPDAIVDKTAELAEARAELDRLRAVETHSTRESTPGTLALHHQIYRVAGLEKDLAALKDSLR